MNKYKILNNLRHLEVKVEYNQGILVVLSAPSGGGKSTIIDRILQQDKHGEYIYSISATTRSPRGTEKNGEDYWFFSKDEFETLVQNDELIEYEKVHGRYYGTPKKPIVEWLYQNKIVLLDIDVFGAKQVKQLFPEHAILIFIKPPSEKVLIQRLEKRNTETTEQIEHRLQRLGLELKESEYFDHIVINENLETAVEEIKNIIHDVRKTQTED